ncbi:hypothetical protein HSRCO_2140 [Halanaeroarchaeum sp. HSR-CO]|nr:hypothetical protein HSRCO_2140 [Halanaeroarchaeum sp. HSR-CO]
MSRYCERWNREHYSERVFERAKRARKGFELRESERSEDSPSGSKPHRYDRFISAHLP